MKPEDGGSTLLRNFSKYYITRRHIPEGGIPPPWEPQIVFKQVFQKCKLNNNPIKLNSYLFTCKLNSLEANYKVSTVTWRYTKITKEQDSKRNKFLLKSIIIIIIHFNSLTTHRSMLIQSQTKGQTKQTRTHKQRQYLGNVYHLGNNDLTGATLTAMI
jgi:hypothetical protein